MQGIKKVINSRMFKVGSLIFVQAFLLCIMIMIIARLDYFMTIFMTIISAIVVVYIINLHENPAYKLTWSIIILAVPLVGGIGYLLFGGRKIPKALRQEMIKSFDESAIAHSKNNLAIKNAKKLPHDVRCQLDYVKNYSYFQYYNNTNTKYYPSGEKMFADMLADLKSAKHFIFLEYFIIEYGHMWSEILKVLKDKVAQNVKVYMLYDDAGCLETLDANYYQELNAMGIHCEVFNPIRPKLAITMNNRDHRKILVIDNRIGYTGGINIADEYINQKDRFGYWKDTGLRLEGEAVLNFTIMFIQFFNAVSNDAHLEYEDFDLKHDNPINHSFVLPFSDSPTDEEDIGRSVHLNMINKAKNYIYMQTPYLILDHDMTIALAMAAKNGVEVIITTPHIPDKSYAFAITQSNYAELVKSGVKIYEFTPGFIHSKVFVCDDEIALVSTINMDYRSYYLHYECGVLITDKDTIETIKQDYIKTLEVSQEITVEDVNKQGFFKRIYQSILNLFAPLM